MWEPIRNVSRAGALASSTRRGPRASSPVVPRGVEHRPAAVDGAVEVVLERLEQL